MFAVCTEVNVPDAAVSDSALQQAREGIESRAIPQLRQAGATAAYWLAPHDGRAISVAVFDSEEQARQAASMIKVGEQAGETPEITFRSIEVLEVLAQL